MNLDLNLDPMKTKKFRLENKIVAQKQNLVDISGLNLFLRQIKDKSSHQDQNHRPTTDRIEDIFQNFWTIHDHQI